MNSERIVTFVRLPALRQVELRFSHYRQAAFKKHTHDTYSIGVVFQGRSGFFHHNQTDLIGRGDLALINPGEVHACNPQPDHALTYYMLYIAPELIEEIAADLYCQPHFVTPIVREAALHQTFSTLCQAMFRSEDEFDLETRLYDALAQLNYAANDAPITTHAKAVEHGRAYLLDNLYRNVSLHELATLTSLSPYHFLRAFRRHTGLPPHAYQLQQRIVVARRLLAAGQPIAHVSAEVGFADQSHFARKFKAFVGATPGEYRSAFSAAVPDSR